MNWIRRQFRTFIRLAKWWRANVTRSGSIVFAALLCCIPTLAQLNRGDYILFWMLAVTFALTAMINWWNQPNPEIQLSLPTAVEAGATSRLRVQIHAVNSPIRTSMIVAMCGNHSNFITPERPATIDRLPKGSSAICQLDFTATRRGRFAVPPIRVASTYPFGFFQMGRRSKNRRETIVFPSYTRIVCDPFRDGVARQRTGDGGIYEFAQRHRDGDYGGSRDYVDGMIDVQWDYRAWARTGSPAVREYSHSAPPKAIVLLDTHRPIKPTFGSNLDVSLEASVSLAAAICAVLTESGYRIVLMGGEANCDSNELPQGAETLPAALERLAELQRAPREDFEHFKSTIDSFSPPCELVCAVFCDWDARRHEFWQNVTTQTARTMRIFLDRNVATRADASCGDFVAVYHTNGQLAEINTCED